MRHKGKVVAARLQTALVLLERLRDVPSLSLNDHISQPGSAGLKSHESYGQKAVERLRLKAINKTHGRRSSNLQAWGQPLLNEIGALRSASAPTQDTSPIIDEAQEMFATALRRIIEEEPLQVRLRNRTVEAVIREVLADAEEKGKSGEVAQFLVGAKLALRFNREIPVYPANKGDRTSHFDPSPRRGDFEIENTVIEVAVGLPDEKHLQQIAEILDQSEAEAWLLTRADRLYTWENELKKYVGLEIKRVVVTSVEAFVGQNITELGGFSAKTKAAKFQELIDLYNHRWVERVGTPGIRIDAIR